jgi:hypothetical protein
VELEQTQALRLVAAVEKAQAQQSTAMPPEPLLLVELALTVGTVVLVDQVRRAQVLPEQYLEAAGVEGIAQAAEPEVAVQEPTDKQGTSGS